MISVWAKSSCCSLPANSPHSALPSAVLHWKNITKTLSYSIGIVWIWRLKILKLLTDAILVCPKTGSFPPLSEAKMGFRNTHQPYHSCLRCSSSWRLQKTATYAHLAKLRVGALSTAASIHSLITVYGACIHKHAEPMIAPLKGLCKFQSHSTRSYRCL